MIGNVGAFCVPDGPCALVAPGIMAPSGVLMVGGICLADVVQRELGAKYALGAIARVLFYPVLLRHLH